MANFAPAPTPETRAAAGDDRPPARPRETIGDLLRRTRIEHGAEIDAVAAALRIRAPFIAAIEQARYDRLPGPVYALGFVRTYAIHLGLDGEEAVRRFKQEAAGFEKRRDLAFPMPLTPRSIPGGRMVLVAAVLAVCAYGIWYYLSTEERSRPERVAEVPSDLMPPPPPAVAPVPVTPPPAADAAAPAPAPAPDLSQAAAAPPPVAPAVPAAPVPPVAAIAPTQAPAEAPMPEPAPAPVTAMVLPPPAADQAPADATPPATPQARVFGAVDGPSHITLKAIKDCWILVRDSDAAQTVVAQRTLKIGDLYRVPDRAGLTLRTGNATGLQVIVDDKPLPALGGTVRTVALDPARLLAGKAVE
jgi:cytoskeleton protein RodZ